MKATIKNNINKKTPVVLFDKSFDDGTFVTGQLQFTRNTWGIMLNHTFVHCSNTLDSAVNKLRKLGITKDDLIFV